MGPTWDPPGSCRPRLGPMLAPWTLLSDRMSFVRIWEKIDRVTTAPHCTPVLLFSEISAQFVGFYQSISMCSNGFIKPHFLFWFQSLRRRPALWTCWRDSYWWIWQQWWTVSYKNKMSNLNLSLQCPMGNKESHIQKFFKTSGQLLSECRLLVTCLAWPCFVLLLPGFS